MTENNFSQCTDEVMEILKADKKACSMMKLFHETAESIGMQGREYEEARKTMLMLIISKTPKAMQVMAHEVYTELNNN
ncbi:hypothetical protein [Rummeliibacillus stabekisii]|uniref:hypothetical protein n=1 Tax=Rummeliibacillus stabekisii TaxID=241244 RepID=UPI0037225E2B